MKIPRPPRLGQLSLRSRVMLGALALSAIGLLAADVATATALRSFLLDRVDRTLAVARLRIPRFGARALGPSDLFIEIRARDGDVLARGASSLRPEQDPPPDIPPSALSGASLGSPAITVGAEEGGLRYRVVVEPLAGGELLVIAVPLREVSETMRRLLLSEALVTVGALGGIALLAGRVVQLGLRPLEEVEATADAIAGGDLSRRVERVEPNTEVGRLGIALNRMLEQIESAFAARQESEARLRRFVADASHELRTPLTSIRGYAELFRQGASARPDDLATAMRRIEEEAARMGVLVEDLLLLARLDQGRPLERSPVDLVRLVSEAVEDARAVEPDRPIRLDFDGEIVVQGDEGRLRQVVGNLLANVRTHTPPASPATVTLRSDAGSAVLEVGDEGPGLAPDQVDLVFERFYRADPARSRGQGGAGLGLSIVAAIAEAHGGRASVVSRPGTGATFRVELPLDGRGGAEEPSS